MKNIFSSFTRILVVVVSMILLSNSISVGQRINTMTTTTFSGGYTPLIINPGTITLASIGASVYYSTSTMSLPFSFNYDGTTYSAGTTLYVRHGHVSFNASDPNYQNYVGNSSYPLIMAPIMGLQISAPDGSSRKLYLLSGVAPNRVLTIEWYRFGDYPSQSLGNVSYQLKLYEGSNTIEFIYEKYSFTMNNPSYASYTKSTGLNGASTPSFVSITSMSNTITTPATNFRYSFPLPIQLSTSPKTLSFGNVGVGANASLDFTITNVGTNGPLNVTSLSIVGSPDFTISAGSPVPPLGIGASANVTVKFTPTAAGVRSGVLTVVSNGLDSGTQSINLNGSGLAPLISVDSNVRFKKTRTSMGDTLTQWLHITNTGQALLSFSSFPITGIDADQYYISRFPANPIAPGVTDSMAITYVPTREGLRTAILTINSNAANTPVIPITLRGTGTLAKIVVTPSPLLFDSVREGQTICKTISIWNPGSDSLKLFFNNLTSNDGDFVYTGLTGQDSIIPPDHIKTVTVCFTPKQQGTRQARLILRTNIILTFETPRRDTGSIIVIDIRGTGVPFGVFANAVSGSPFLDSAIVGVEVCRTDTLKNNGDADILVTDAVFTGGVFKQTGLPTLPFLLKARSSVKFQLCGTPDKQGLLSGSLTFTGRSSGSDITLNLPLGIYGLNSCATPTPGDLFTSVILPNNGSDSSLCVWIHNCGDIAAIYTGTLSGAAKADYTIASPTTTANIAAGDSVQFCLTFKPSAEGLSSASLDVTSPTAPTVNVPLGGSAGCAVLAAASPNIPKTGVGANQPFTITVNNTGSFLWNPGATATVTPIGVFTIDNATLANVAAGNGSLAISGTFSPIALGVATAKVTFLTAGPCGNTLEVDLSGEGVVNSVNPTAKADGFILEQSYPNPSQGNTNFNYTTPRETEVRISLVDLTGKLIRTLVSGRVSEGMHSVNFDAKDLPSGTYVYLLESGSTRLVRQFILTK